MNIIPDEGLLGCCNFYKWDFFCGRDNYVTALLATTAAEQEFFGSAVGGKRDHEHIAVIADNGWPQVGGKRLPALNEVTLRKRARRLVRKHRQKIECVARALMRQQTLSQSEVDELIASPLEA